MAQGILNEGNTRCFAVCGLNLMGSSKIFQYYGQYFPEEEEELRNLFEKFRGEQCRPPPITSCTTLQEKFKSKATRNVSNFLRKEFIFLHQTLRNPKNQDFLRKSKPKCATKETLIIQNLPRFWN